MSFQGEGAHVGERHLFVRLAGCNIRCVYCDTPDSLERTKQCCVYRLDGTKSMIDNPLAAASLAALVKEFVASGPVDAVAVTGGEPLLQAEFLREFLALAPLTCPVLLETNGILPVKLAQVIDLVDIVSMDVKLPSNSGERPFWNEHRQFAAIARRKELYAKILIDEQTTLADVRRAGALLSSEAPEITVFLQPIANRDGVPALTRRRLDETFLALRQEVASVRVLPQTHKIMGIQ